MVSKYSIDSVVEPGVECKDCQVADFLTVKRFVTREPKILLLKLNRYWFCVQQKWITMFEIKYYRQQCGPRPIKADPIVTLKLASNARVKYCLVSTVCKIDDGSYICITKRANRLFFINFSLENRHNFLLTDGSRWEMELSRHLQKKNWIKSTQPERNYCFTRSQHNLRKGWSVIIL